MGEAINYILVGVLGYIVMFGLKDREDPTVTINFGLIFSICCFKIGEHLLISISNKIYIAS